MPDFVILLSIFALIPTHSGSHVYTPAHADARILMGEWQKPKYVTFNTDSMTDTESYQIHHYEPLLRYYSYIDLVQNPHS